MGFHADRRSTWQDVGSLSERLVCSGGQKACRELRKRDSRRQPGYGKKDTAQDAIYGKERKNLMDISKK